MKAVRIPRGTCRLFGAIKALGTLKRCAILVHGPKGCVYHINYILGMRGDRPSQVYSTCLDEHDVIFGAEDRLREAIEELDTTGSYDLIAVLSCCASSIIGEDVTSVAREARTRARVIGIEAGGFEGDFRQGHSETLRSLVDELTVAHGSIVLRSVNLLGVLRSGPDLRELVSLLGRMGVSIIAVLTAGASRFEIERMSSAALNVVLCESSGKEAAELLREKYGTPFLIVELPIGAGATRQFCNSVQDALGISKGAEGLDCPALPPIPPRRIALIGGPTRAVAFTRFLQELGIEPALIVLDFDLGTEERLRGMVQCEILVEPDQNLIVEKLREKKVDLILGGMLERPVAAMLGIGFFDMMHGSQKTVGEEGMRTLIRVLQESK
ncbi:MAG: nitrogenase component 1 [Methanomicrobiales archaeon]|nr:nitrogenase component 1 [Methanomicrobiales archaeon]